MRCLSRLRALIACGEDEHLPSGFWCYSAISRCWPQKQQSLECQKLSPELSQILELPDVVDALGSACCDPLLLTRLGQTRSCFHEHISSKAYQERRVSELLRFHGWVAGCTSLEQVAVGQAMMELCSKGSKNHIYFHYGGGTQIRACTQAIVDRCAKLCHRHAQLQLHVDAHVGARAPAGVAQATAMARAAAVIRKLKALGVGERRLSSTAWGMQVSSRWSEPEDDSAARAELFCRFDGKEFPERPSYYKLVPASQQPRGHSHHPLAIDSGDEQSQS